MPRSSASTRACGLIITAARMPPTGASSGSRLRNSRYRDSCSTASMPAILLISTAWCRGLVTESEAVAWLDNEPLLMLLLGASYEKMIMYKQESAPCAQRFI